MLVFPNLPSSYIKHGDPTWERPNNTIEYENGAKDVRNTTSRGRFVAMPVKFTCPEDDFNVLFDFLDAQVGGAATPFQYTHPTYGTGIVRAPMRFQPRQIAYGPPAWFIVELELEGQFYA